MTELDAGKDGVPVSPEAARNRYPAQVALAIAIEALRDILTCHQGDQCRRLALDALSDIEGETGVKP